MRRYVTKLTGMEPEHFATTVGFCTWESAQHNEMIIQFENLREKKLNRGEEKKIQGVVNRGGV